MGDAPNPSSQRPSGADKPGVFPAGDGLTSTLRGLPAVHDDQVLKVAFGPTGGPTATGGAPPAEAQAGQFEGMSAATLRLALAELSQARTEQIADMAAAWSATEAALATIAGPMPRPVLHDLLKQRTSVWRTYYVQAAPQHDRLAELHEDITGLEGQAATAETIGRLIALRAEASALQAKTDQAWGALTERLQAIDEPLVASSGLAPDVIKRLLDAQEATAQTQLAAIITLERQLADLTARLQAAEEAAGGGPG